MWLTDKQWTAFGVVKTILTILLKFIVPIIPEFLYDIRHPDAPLDTLPRTPLTTPMPCDRITGEITTLSPGECELSGMSIEYQQIETFQFIDWTENASYIAEIEERHKELVGETVEVGLMFASKAFVQLLANPIVGPLTHK